MQKRLLKNVILDETLRYLNLAQRKKVQNAITTHVNALIESQTQRITNRLELIGIKSYFIDKKYDEEFNTIFFITILDFDFQFTICKNSVKNKIIEKDFENIEEYKILVDINDEYNSEKNEYNACRNAMKSLFKHIASKTSIDLKTCREMEISKLTQLYKINSML